MTINRTRYYLRLIDGRYRVCVGGGITGSMTAAQARKEARKLNGETNKRDKTQAARQARRQAALDMIAQDAGWTSWSTFETDVKNGLVEIPKRPGD